jgi:magnesium transporter
MHTSPFRERPARPAAPAAPHGPRRRRPGETAGGLLTRRIPLAQPGETVSVVLSRLRGAALDAVDTVVVVDGRGALYGMARMTDVLAAPAEQRVDELVLPESPSVLPGADQEWVATMALRHGLVSVPVCTPEGELLGVVTAPTLLGILRREHVEDLHRLAGIRREEADVRSSLEGPPVRRARHRLPWLLAGLAGCVLSAALMAGFKEALVANVAVAFFVPGIVYLADAIGTQTEAIMVRGLSLVHTPFRRQLLGELRTGLLLGGTLGVLVLPAVALGFGDVRLAFAVAAGVFCAGAAATTIGALLPWLLAHAGRDPAFGSGPLATIVQDLLSLLIYFAAVQLFLDVS